MILKAGLIALAIISDCADDAKKLGEARDLVNAAGKAKNLLAIRGIPEAELTKVFDLPMSFDGDVAQLHLQKDLAVFGIVEFERKGFEFLQVYGFDEFPMPVAVIYVNKNKPSNRDAIHFPMGQEIAFAAIRNHPALLAFMREQGFFNFTPEQEAKAIKDSAVLVHKTYFDAEAADVAPRSWAQVRREILIQEQDRRSHWRGYEELQGEGQLPVGISKTAKEATVPNPPNREVARTKFGGFLPRDGYAIAALQYTLHGKDQGLSVYLNPQNAAPFHQSFAGIPERIAIEGRFRIEWLKLNNPIVIEIDGSHDLRQMFLVFEGEEDLPRGLPFFRVDLATGQRLSERPIVR